MTVLLDDTLAGLYPWDQGDGIAQPRRTYRVGDGPVCEVARSPAAALDGALAMALDFAVSTDGLASLSAHLGSPYADPV